MKKEKRIIKKRPPIEMKWDDAKRKTNTATNWSEKCVVAAEAPREAVHSRYKLAGCLKPSLNFWLIHDAYHWHRVALMPTDHSAKRVQLFPVAPMYLHTIRKPVSTQHDKVRYLHTFHLHRPFFLKSDCNVIRKIQTMSSLAYQRDNF